MAIDIAAERAGVERRVQVARTDAGQREAAEGVAAFEKRWLIGTAGRHSPG